MSTKTRSPKVAAESNGKPDGAAIYRALVAATKSGVKGSKLVGKENKSGKYASVQVKGKHVGYLHTTKSGAWVEIRVDGQRTVHKLASETDVPAAVEALAAKATELKAKQS